jgi:predicted permease
MAQHRRPFRKSAGEDEMDREIGYHIRELTEANIAAGMSPEEARRRAMLEFGGREQVKQELREVHSSRILESIRFNLKAGIRFMRRSPSFSLAVVLTLALAIGANSAVFSAIDAVLLRPLSFPDGDRLVALYQHDSENRSANRLVAPVRLEDWNRMSSAFQAISGYYLDDLSETSGPLPERVNEALVAPRFLEVLGVSPSLGRNLTSEEEHFGGPASVLISYRFWQRRFGGDPEVIGKKLRFGQYSYSIVGIMPASFSFPTREVDIWAPSPPDAPYSQSREATWFTVIGRMKTGVTLAQAQADLATVQSRLGKQFPKPDGELTVESQALKTTVVGGAGGSLWLLYGSVSLLLLIACSNIAALLLARTAEREHEISIRFSLGASRRSIVAQLLTEVSFLALAGSLLGLLLAAGAVRWFHLLAKTLPRADEITLDWRIVLYSLGCAMATTLLCGLFPALRGTRRELAGSLAATSRTHTSNGNPLQWVLVGVQVTLAVTLLTGAGLLLRSMRELGRVAPGFDPSHVLTFQVSGSWSETTDYKGLNQRIGRTLDALRSLPGVDAAATSSTLPGIPAKYQSEFKVDGHEGSDRRILADSRFVSAGYFETMRIPLLRGEACRDNVGVVVNQSFANAYLAGSAAIGHDLQTSGNWTGKINGLVADAREEGLNAQPVPTVYWCGNAPNPFPNYLVRAKGDPASLSETIRRRIHEIEPGRSVFAMVPLQEHLDDAFAENRLRTTLLALFAATAVSLACIGLYGTLSYLARRRRREVGVRLALGAARGQIVASFLSKGLRVAITGCLAGLSLSLITDRLLTSMLYGVSAIDAETYFAVPVLILLVSTLSSLAPAWRAALVDPMEVLRQE